MNFSGAVADYFAPLFQSALLNVDWLDKCAQSYSVEAVNANPVLRHYTGGKALCAFDFYLTARLAYSRDRVSNEENLTLWNDLALWVMSQNQNRILPILPAGYTPQRVQVLRPGVLHDSEHNGTGVYQLACRLLYLADEI